jgi:hypothetical protein
MCRAGGQKHGGGMRQAHQPKHLITFLERSMLCARVRVWEGKGGSAHDRRCKAKRYLAGRSVHGNGRRRRPVCSRVRPGGQGSDRRRFGGACNRTNPRIGRDQLLSNLSGSGGSVIGDKPAKSAPNPCVRLAGLSEPRREMPAAAEKQPEGSGETDGSAMRSHRTSAIAGSPAGL